MENESPKRTGENEKQPAKKPKWRLFRWIAKGTGGLLLLAVIAWTGAYLYASHDLNSTIEELERDGYTTHLQNLARPPVPAEESTTEAYRAAFDKMNEISSPGIYCKHGYVTNLIPDDHLHEPTEENLNAAFAWVEETREVVDAFLSAGDPRLCRFEWNSSFEGTGTGRLRHQPARSRPPSRTRGREHHGSVQVRSRPVRRDYHSRKTSRGGTPLPSSGEGLRGNRILARRAPGGHRRDRVGRLPRRGSAAG